MTEEQIETIWDATALRDDRVMAFARALLADSKTTREADLRLALRDAIEQLEGWVHWKCPKRYVAEHEANIERLREVLTGVTS